MTIAVELKLEETKSKLEKCQTELAESKRKLRGQRELVKELERAVEDYHASKFNFEKQKKPRVRKKGCFFRVAFGDTHGCHIDQKAFNCLINDLEQLKPKEIVHGGDCLEAGGWLAQHHTMGYVAETEYTFADDAIASNLMWDRLQATCPNSDITLIEGNHDARLEKFAVTASLRNQTDAGYLLGLIGPKQVMHLEKRGIKYVSRSQPEPGIKIPSTYKSGKCYFHHPQKTGGKNAAASFVNQFRANVVYFHTHRRDSFSAEFVDERLGVSAWNPGCMCKLQKYYMNSDPSGHNHGYHLQLVQPDQSFLGINVPIMNGVSYLSPLLEMFKIK